LGKTRRWRFAADRGGTFTDVVGSDPVGCYHTLKLLSVSPDYEDAAIEGIRRILGLKQGEGMPEELIEGIRFGTTAATNALLERRGGSVALLITRGFRDLLEIGYQDRPDIFRLCIEKPLPLYSAVIEVDERVDYQGGSVKGIDTEALLKEIDRLNQEEIDAAAVVLMHSWANPAHELVCEQLLRRRGVSTIFLSHRTSSIIKIVDRGQSTLVDAYLGPVMARYLEGIKKVVGNIPVAFMQSSGVLTPPSSFTGRNALFSGPAGGAIAVGRIAEERAIGRAIGFDMGGTSTDVSRYEGGHERVYEKEVGGVPLQTEMIDIVTVAAGGGSVLDFDGQRMTVGPQSAGAYPGPACYGFGGPLTVTDANLLTGRLIPSYFPKTFGLRRNEPLNEVMTRDKFVLLTSEINDATSSSLSPEEVAEGFLRIANEKMALAIREISVSKGFDVREYALVCFGGAGGQHACAIASLLDIREIVVHPLCSLMSAYGTGLSMPAGRSAKTVLRIYNRETHDELRTLFEEMEKALPLDIADPATPLDTKREIDLRPKGSETFLTLPFGYFEETVSAFKKRYERLFGFRPDDGEFEVVNLRTEVRALSEFFPPYSAGITGTDLSPASYRLIHYQGKEITAPVYMMESLPPRTKIRGAAFIIDPNFSVVVDPEYEAEADENGMLVMRRSQATKEHQAGNVGKADPVLLEVFNRLFTEAANQMGATLRNTAHSVNMKERLDFSCAVFDAEGNLVANAQHIPVHLGSMSDTVKEVLSDKRRDMRKGDVYLTNNPYRGGSHLPDMTVVCPVFSEDRGLIFFAAARGHHSDVGGQTPGSMPATVSHLEEEGVLIDNLLIVRDGVFLENSLRQVLLKGRYPVRNISERIYDLKAQVAACHKGVDQLLGAVDRYGLETVHAYMRFIRENAAHSVEKGLRRFLTGRRFASTFEDRLDDNTWIRVALSIAAGPNVGDPVRACIDFTGTDTQHLNDNLNAPLSIARSAVMYVLRTLVDRDIPLNSGCLDPVEIIIPAGTILNPLYPAPVASGNVETSQRIVDVLLGAFRVAAASQGTMNNFLFEVEGEAPYYETLAGGAGALEGCPGASGVQVHMTNTRITDPEVLEFRHPGVRIERFTLRRGSGGKGMFPGGDGVIREIRFLKPATVSLLSERRVYAPYGMAGGQPGRCGVNLLRREGGRTETLGHREAFTVKGNDIVVIETPGGGGYGSPKSRHQIGNSICT
jgi:5-oxoprolinase (ATP-hydrolysing)